MKRCFYIFTSIAFLLFSGCEKDEELFNETNSDLKETVIEENYPDNKSQEESLPSYLVDQLKSFESEEINKYDVTLTKRVVNVIGDNVTTTFNYTVSGKGYTPQLDSFYLEIPDCAGSLSSWTPQQASGFNDGVLKWNSSVSKDGSQNFSISFVGKEEVPLGIINSTVTRGSNIESAKILGPCDGVYKISGSIYIDEDNFGVKDASENGIPSIPVSLFNSAGDSITTVSTDSDGLYSFKVLEGDYTIAIDEDFLNNPEYTSNDNTSEVFKNVTENLSGINFAYIFNTGKVTTALEDKVIRVDTEPTRYWVQQLRNAGKKNADYDSDEIIKFLTAIEVKFLTKNFKFGNDKIKNAQAILERPIRTDFDAFLAQLLTAHLNVESGKGALKSNGERNTVFNDALLIYGEAVACRESGNCLGETSKTAATAETKIRTNDTRMFLAFNGSGGVN